MDATDWDHKYLEAELLWSNGPNQWVEQVAGDLEPGRALDLAAGEGRNAIWLAELGWSATAVDFSPVAVDRARRIAGQRLGAQAYRFSARVADVLDADLEQSAYDLVLVIYLQLGPAARRTALRAAASAVAPGGRLLVVAHDSDNIANGYGGPSDPEVLYTAQDVANDLTDTGLRVERAERVTRVVATATGAERALDCLVVASRPETEGGSGR
jgi:SAM-dependent methyltransferase